MNSVSIPVVGTAVVNSPDYLLRLFYSIDYPVENFFVVDNNGRGELQGLAESLKSGKNRYVKNVHVCTLPRNIGCSGAWNLIIKSFVVEPYWLIVNNDVMFMPGFLAKMRDAMVVEGFDVVHGRGGAFDVFALNQKTVKEVGLFDESFYPAYFEDIDYTYRMRGRPLRRCMDVGGEYLHGSVINSYDDGCMTMRNETAENSRKIRRANAMNGRFFARKWGSNPLEGKEGESWAYPFNNKAIPPSATFYNIGFRLRKDLGF